MGEFGRVKKSVQYLVVGEVAVLSTLAILLAFIIFPFMLSANPIKIPTGDQLKNMTTEQLQEFADIVNSMNARLTALYVLAFVCWIVALGGGIAYGMMSEREIWEQKAGDT